MMEERPPLWEASGHGIMVGEIIASMVDIKKNNRANPVPSSFMSVLSPSSFEGKHSRYEVIGDVFEGN